MKSRNNKSNRGINLNYLFIFQSNKLRYDIGKKKYFKFNRYVCTDSRFTITYRRADSANTDKCHPTNSVMQSLAPNRSSHYKTTTYTHSVIHSFRKY